jgi:hypothetical protein
MNKQLLRFENSFTFNNLKSLAFVVVAARTDTAYTGQRAVNKIIGCVKV